MNKIVSALKARTNLGELLNEVYYKDREIVIERKGVPIVRVIKFKEPSKGARNLEKYLGVFKHLDTEAMKRRIAEDRKRPARGTPLPSLHD